MARRATAGKWHFHEAGSSPAVTCILSSARLRASPGALLAPSSPGRPPSSPQTHGAQDGARGSTPGSGGVPSSSPSGTLAIPEETRPPRAAAPAPQSRRGWAGGSALPGRSEGLPAARPAPAPRQPPSPGTGSRDLPPATASGHKPSRERGETLAPRLGHGPRGRALLGPHADPAGSSSPAPTPKISHNLYKINLF